MSATWGAQLGVVKSYSWGYQIDDVPLSNEGSVFDDELATVGKRLVAVVEFLVPVTFAESSTAASLVFVAKKADGTTSMTETLANMVPRNRSKSHSDKSPAMYTIEFRSKGSAAAPGVPA